MRSLPRIDRRPRRWSIRPESRLRCGSASNSSPTRTQCIPGTWRRSPVHRRGAPVGCSAGTSRREPCAADFKHSLPGLVNDVDLLRRLDDFPGSDEAPGNDQAVTRRYRYGVADGVCNDAGTLQDLAILLLGVGDAPFADLAAPDTGEELSADVGVVLPDALFGIAGDQLLAG